MSLDEHRDPLPDWIARFRDGQLSPEEAAKLNDRLAADPQAREFWTSHLLLQILIENELAPDRAEAAGSSNRTPKSPGSPVFDILGDLGRQGWGFAADNALLLSVLAVLVVVGILAIGKAHKEPEVANRQAETSNSQPEISTPSPAFARLVRAKDCRWNGSSSAPQVGQMLQVGQSLNLASGVVEINFDIGAKVILQSPAAFQLVSSKSARLEMGKATVEINDEAARGFKILTPEAAFVDQGTEFGVEVSPGGSSKIHVFQGRVDIDQKARAGQAAPPTHRLVENAGARMEAGEPGMLLVQDTGECFIRSMDDAGRDQHVVAYWRFEDRPVGVLLPDTGGNARPVCATVDSSFNGNDLYVGNTECQPKFSADVPAASVAQTGTENRSCFGAYQPTAKNRRLNVYTHSEFSHAAPLDIQKIAPAQWTIEASVKVAELVGKPQGFLGRDTNFSRDRLRNPARLTFQVNAQNRFAIGFHDADDRFHEAVAEDLPVQAGQWYHLAATSDGRVLRLYVDAMDGRGYAQRAAAELPATGSTALGKGGDDAEWAIGRAGNAGEPAAWLWFQGWIDEVRISDIAREPAEFLFAPKEQDKG